MCISKVSIYYCNIYLLFWLYKFKAKSLALSFVYNIFNKFNLVWLSLWNRKQFFPEFSGCSASNLNITNKEDLLKSLNEIVPNCKDVTFKILGFSLATINVLISGLIMIISTVIIKYEKNR